jgi:hypothetical protein
MEAIMRSSIRALIVVVALLLPGGALANGFEITVLEPLGVEFGPAGATCFCGTFHDIYVDGVFQETPWLSSFDGNVTFETGPMLSLSIGLDNSSYLFGPGTFTLTAHWTDQFGNAQEGRYIAPLLELQIYVLCERQLQEFSCGYSGGGGEYSLGEAFVSIGPGLFDPSLASILRLARRGGASDFDLLLDGITGSPSDSDRLSGSQSGWEAIDFPVAIPEPSILSLLLLSPILGLRLRR